MTIFTSQQSRASENKTDVLLNKNFGSAVFCGSVGQALNPGLYMCRVSALREPHPSAGAKIPM